MKHMKFASLVALSLAVGAGAALAQDKEKAMPSDAVVNYAKEFVAKNLTGNEKLNEAIKASTANTKKYSFEDVTVVDSQWRVAKSGADKEKKAASALAELAPDKDIAAHTKAGEDLIKAARENDTSKWLTELQEKAEPKGAITEIFVMDGWGWNVAQTGGTSDYYQGDEGKWQKTFAVGKDGIEVLPIEEEDGIKYAHVSLPIMDGDKAIGAVTVGVDVDKVK